MMAIKVLFRKSDGRLLGAQVLAEDGVAKRVDAFAMAIQMGATVYDRSAAHTYYATRILMQNGFKARNISGGMLARSHRAAA